MKSAFQNISEMNTAFGNLFGSALTGDKITDYQKLLNQAKNLYDELDELRDDGFALLKHDINSVKGRQGMVDAIGDIIVFHYGLPHFLGVDYVTPVVEHKEKAQDNNKNDQSVEVKIEKVFGELKNCLFNIIDIIVGDENPITKRHKDYLAKIESYSSEVIDVKFEKIYNDVKLLIDDIISLIENKASISELKKAIEELDLYINALCKHYNINLTEMIEQITLSNMSKLCKDKEEEEATLNKYRSEGVEVYAKPSPLLQENGNPYLVVYSSKEQTVNGKVYRADKFLKCVNWFEPDLTKI